MLEYYGLVNHIHIPVGGPEVEGAWVGHRIDRKLSSFGIRFYEQNLQSTYYGTTIFRRIKDSFIGAKNELKELIDAEAQLDATGLYGDERDRKYVIIDELRRKITKDLKFVTLSIRER